MRRSGPVLAAIFAPALAAAQPTDERQTFQLPSDIPTVCIEQVMRNATGVHPELDGLQVEGITGVRTYLTFTSSNGSGEETQVHLTHDFGRGAPSIEMRMRSAPTAGDLRKDYYDPNVSTWRWGYRTHGRAAAETTELAPSEALPSEASADKQQQFLRLRKALSGCMGWRAPL